MVTRLALAALFVLGCTRPAAPAAPASTDAGAASGSCALAGKWKADLALYDGTATLTAQSADAYAVEIEGKGVQRGQGHWEAKTRQLRLDLADASYMCQASDDCRTLRCTDAKGQALILTRP